MVNATNNMKKVLVFILIAIVIINLPPTKWIFGREDILYSNANGSFTYDEVNYTGRNFDLCMDNFQAFKSISKTDTVLYRITPINILKIWRLGDYLIDKRYKLPYKPWKEIETVRGPVVNKTGFQAF